ncbi:MAG: DNA internalization-related competence protein ComEC/Rec2 [Granulosicoccus sp.]
MRAFAISWLCTSVILLNLPGLPAAGVLILIVLVLLAVAYVASGLRRPILGILVALVSIGLTLAQVANRQLAPEQQSEDLQLTVSVASIPQTHDYGMTFFAKVVSCDSCTGEFGPQRIRLSWYGWHPTLQTGETWQLTVRLKSPGLLRNAGSFDAVKWAMTQRLDARGYVRNPQGAERLAGPSGFSLTELRQNKAERIAALPSADTYSGIITALSLGMRGGVEEPVRRLLQDTGTAHLLAISGLHISLVAFWGFVLGKQSAYCLARLSPGRAFDVHLPDPRAAGLIISFLAALGYTLLAGFGLPTQRALVMLTVWIAATWWFRFLPPGAALCVALIAVLIVNPLNPLTVGFWLSFGTVAALFYLHKGHQVRTPDPQQNHWIDRLWLKLAPLAKTHVMISICLLPVSAWFFQSGSLVAPLANLLAVPWTGLIVVPLSLASASLSSLLPVVADYALAAAQWSVQCLLLYLEFLDDRLQSAVVLSMPSSAAFVLSLIGLLSLLSPKGLGFRWLALPLLLPALLFNVHRAPMDGFELHVLDVGQGLAALVFTEEKTLLFDTGGKVSSNLSMFESVVIPYLHAQGRRKIDTLVISHTDEDHSFGAKDVVARFPEIELFVSETLDLPEHVNQRQCIAGKHWKEDAVSFAFLHPALHDRGSQNDLSCVLLVYTGLGRALLTADIEARAEAKLASRVEAEGALDVTVMVAPHHGSSTSSSSRFLQVIKPRYVVFPSGHGNRYGFPHVDVQLRYRQLGAHPYTTGKDGAITFLLGESGLNEPPISWWESHGRFWHRFFNPDCWQASAGESTFARMLELAQTGQILCGK